jgi:hypothetical protein
VKLNYTYVLDTAGRIVSLLDADEFCGAVLDEAVAPSADVITPGAKDDVKSGATVVSCGAKGVPAGASGVVSAGAVSSAAEAAVSPGPAAQRQFFKASFISRFHSFQELLYNFKSVIRH